MEVFLNEPILDWIGGVANKDEDADILRDDISWEPKRKVDIVRRKLKGVNPIYLMMEDVDQNVSCRFGILLISF